MGGTQGGERAVQARALSRTYQLEGGGVPALRDVTFGLAKGSFTTLVGPSGSGKSTLLRLLACLDRADSGALFVDGSDVARMTRRARTRMRRFRLGYVVQAPQDNLLDYLTVREHLLLGARLRGRTVRDAEVDDLLEVLGLGARSGHVPRQLSGGEQQRVAIGFAAIGSPALVVADEPTGQLDHVAVATVLDTFAALASRGVTIIAATHDPAVARRADLVLSMADGRIDG